MTLQGAGMGVGWEGPWGFLTWEAGAPAWWSRKVSGSCLRLCQLRSLASPEAQLPAADGCVLGAQWGQWAAWDQGKMGRVVTTSILTPRKTWEAACPGPGRGRLGA